MSRKGSKFSKAGFRNSVLGTASILKEGDLKKKIAGALFGSSFKTRYFVINAHYLKYYEVSSLAIVLDGGTHTDVIRRTERGIKQGCNRR